MHLVIFMSIFTTEGWSQVISLVHTSGSVASRCMVWQLFWFKARLSKSLQNLQRSHKDCTGYSWHHSQIHLPVISASDPPWNSDLKSYQLCHWYLRVYGWHPVIWKSSCPLQVKPCKPTHDGQDKLSVQGPRGSRTYPWWKPEEEGLEIQSGHACMQRKQEPSEISEKLMNSREVAQEDTRVEGPGRLRSTIQKRGPNVQVCSTYLKSHSTSKTFF